MMTSDIVAKAGEIVEQNTGEQAYCVLALIDTDGFPAASTITPAKAEGIRHIYFCTGFGTRTERIAGSPRASVCYNSSEFNITLVGTIEVVTDLTVKREMWYDGLYNHFSGPDDPNFCVLHFCTQRYSLLVDWISERGPIR